MNDIKEQFAHVSKKYDSQRRHLIPCFDDFYTACLPLVKSLTHAKKVLDIGAGTGLFSQFIYEVNPELQFTLIDFSSQMLEVARERFQGESNFKFLTWIFPKTPCPANSTWSFRAWRSTIWRMPIKSSFTKTFTKR